MKSLVIVFLICVFTNLKADDLVVGKSCTLEQYQYKISFELNFLDVKKVPPPYRLLFSGNISVFEGGQELGKFTGNGVLTHFGKAWSWSFKGVDSNGQSLTISSPKVPEYFEFNFTLSAFNNELRLYFNSSDLACEEEGVFL